MPNNGSSFYERGRQQAVGSLLLTFSPPAQGVHTSLSREWENFSGSNSLPLRPPRRFSRDVSDVRQWGKN